MNDRLRIVVTQRVDQERDVDALDLVAPSLREELRRSPRRNRRKWVHRQMRRTLRGHPA